MPTRGGVPKRITPLTPSYMHGWTPDAKWLVYTGGRTPKGATAHEYDIYKIASDGSGKEINLTNSAGPRRRPGSEPRRQVDLFQFHALGADADLAHGARRQERRNA